MTTEQELTDSLSNKFKIGDTLRRRLLVSILPVVFIPLAIASTIGYTITERKAKTTILNTLENKAHLSNNTITAFIQNSFDTIDLIARSPNIIEGIKAGNKKSQEQQLTQQSIAEIEQKFAKTKLLQDNINLNNYLQQIVKSGQAAEVFVTESNGFNIAYADPTSDFVQSDESWWIAAKQRGKAMSEPEIDESARASVIPFSQAVIDPNTGEFLGIVKMGIPINNLIDNISAYVNQENLRATELHIIYPDDLFVLYSTDSSQITTNLDDDDDDKGEANPKADLDDDDENVNADSIIGGKTIF